MAGEVPRVGPNQSPLSARPLLHEGPLSSPYDFDRKSGKQGKGKRDEPEPEAPEPEEEEEDESGHLDNDSFARRRKKEDVNNFLNDKLPWEAQEEDRQRRLEELKKKRGTGPLGAKPGPLGRGGTGPLGAKRLGEKPPEITPPRSLGRQVEGGFDPTAAVNSTFAAYQNLKERQEERAREAEEREAAEGPRPIMPSAAWDPAAEVESPPSRPAPPAAPPSKKPGTGALGPPHPLGRPEAAPPRKPGTGAIKPAATPPRQEPPARPAAASGPSWVDQTVPVVPPRPERAVPPAEKPVASAGAFMCQIRVVDAGTGEPMKGARLEFEPSEDDLLPVVNVVTDAHGWYRANDLAHGRYQLAVRAPGYIPQGMPVVVAEGRACAEIIRMEKP